MLPFDRSLLCSRLCRGLAIVLLLAAPCAGQDHLASAPPEKVFEGSGALRKVALSPDGMTALLLQLDNTFRAVALPSGRSLRQFGPIPGKITAMAVSGATGAALVAAEKELWVVPLGNEDSPRKLWASDAVILDLSLSPDLDLLAVGTSKGARVLNPDTGAALWSASAWMAKPCATVRFAPVGGTLALGVGKTVQLHAVPDFKLKQTWTLSFPVLALAFSADARSLAVGGGQGGLLLKRVADGETLKYLNTDFAGKDVALLTFAHDSTELFAAAGPKLQAFSDLDENTASSNLVTLDKEVLSLAFSKSASVLFAATRETTSLTRWAVPDPLRSGARPRKDLPRVRVLSPLPGAKVSTESVALAFKVSFPADRPVDTIRILANSRPARITAAPGGPVSDRDGQLRGTFQSGATYTCTVALPDRDTTLLVVAEGAQSSSEPNIVPLQRTVESRPKGNAKVVPPGITLVSPAAEALLQSAALDVVVRVNAAAGQPVLALRVTLDGVPVPLREVLQAGGSPFDPAVGWVNGESYRLPVQVPDHDCTLSVIAETAFASSAPATARLRWKAQSAGAGPAPRNGEESPVKTGDGPDTGKVKATAEATRILEGNPQGAPVLMEVDSKGRLRWKEKAPDSSKKPALRGTPAAAAPAETKAPSPGQPLLQVLAPASGSRFKEKDLQLSVKVSAPKGQDVSRLLVYVDGSPAEAVVQSASGAPLNPPYPSGQAFKVRVALPPQDCQLSIIAENAASQSRPYLLKLKYDGKAGPAAATRSVSQLAKPKVTIFEPQPNALVRGNRVQIGVRVGLDPRQPPPAIRVLVDAQEVKAERAVPQRGAATTPQPASDRGGTEEIQYYVVPIPAKDCTIVAYAETPYATSDPSLVKLRWDSPTTAPSAGGIPTLYLLSVGVSKYKDKNFTLQYPAKDAKDFAEAMKLQKGKLYKDVVARIRTDEQATRDNVMDDLEWIQRQATQRDMVIVFFAGHGINDVVTGNYYYLPFDANMEAVKRTMIPGSEIHSTLAKLTGTRLLFMDTCHAGTVTGTATRGLPDMQQFLQDLKEGGQGLVVITSSRPGQKSQEHPSWNNGAFTKALVEGLKGKATKDRQGFVTFTALDAYITQRVKELTKGTQAPASQKSTEVSDFPLAFSEN